MVGKASKRQRKHKIVHSLKSKGTTAVVQGLDLLTSELGEQYHIQEGGSNAIILPSKSAAKHLKSERDDQQESGKERTLSKAEQRKLKQVKLKAQRRENLAEVLSSLQSNQLEDQDLALLRPLHARGARETKRQRLRRELRMQRAGLQLPGNAQLLRTAPRCKAEKDSNDEVSSDSDDAMDDDRDGDGVNNMSAAAVAAASNAGRDAVSDSDVEHGSNTDASQHAADADGGRAAKRQRCEPDLQQQQQLLPGPAPGPDAAAAARVEQQRLLAQARLEAQRLRQEYGITDEDEGGQAARQAAATAAAAALPGGAHRVVSFQRPSELEEVRTALPITGMEAEVMEAVAAHDVLVLCGETGCGKTTQVPQFLLEAGYGCSKFPERRGAVGVTQPRRLAAISTATRVAAELGGQLGELVGYQVRYDKVVGAATALRFMTDGILLRQVQEDFLLQRYSAIIIDEAHERSLNTDLLIGMLSRIVPLRRKMWEQQRQQPSYDPAAEDAVHPLKLIIMSATLRTQDFTKNARLFPTSPPVINVPARQFPVTVHFARRTELTDYVGAAFKKAVRIHQELPPGGVLVFLTGQREVEYLCAKLTHHFNKRRAKAGTSTDPDAAASDRPAPSSNGSSAGNSALDGDEPGGGLMDDMLGGHDRAEMAASGMEAAPLIEDDDDDDDIDDYEELNSSVEEDEEVQVLGGDAMTPEELAAAEKKFEQQFTLRIPSTVDANGLAEAGPAPVYVLPLYAMLPQERQARVFGAVPAGHRLIVVATNVAETSLTIPGIRYVVDAGRSKQKLLESGGGLARYEVRWISQASALQRAGRAGRTGPGHCYRLFSSAHYNDTFPQHTPPEIVNTALEGVVLVMKSMAVEKVQNFPFPTPPEPTALLAAECCLVALSALEPSTRALTALGRAMALFPISPRHSRMLLEVAAWQHQQSAALDATAAAEAVGGRPAKSSSQAAKALPYAVALAAAMSVESPFVHVDTPSVGDQGRGGAAAGESEDDAGPSGNHSAEDAANREAARLRAQQAHAAHLKFRSNDSDALAALHVLCAFEAAGETDEFCRQNFLHARHLREMADLHRQLAHSLGTVQLQQLPHLLGPSAAATGRDGGAGSSSGSSCDVKALASELAAAAKQGSKALLAAITASRCIRSSVQDGLRRAIAAGWADQVSRRMRSAEYVQRLQEQASSRKRHAVRYMPCMLEEEVFLHPRSALHKAAPEFVVYTQLVRTAKRPYMAGLTAIDPTWLSQCGTPLAKLSSPLTEPPPVYNAATDTVMAWHDVAYGPKDWPLPRCVRRHPDLLERAAVFAAALLEGKAVPGFSEIQPLLSSPPSVLMRPEMRSVARVGELLGAMQRRGVDCAAALTGAWVRDPAFLQAELAMWVPKQQHKRLLRVWSHLVGAATASVDHHDHHHHHHQQQQQQQRSKKSKPKQSKKAAKTMSS